jgi:hypothetical protein
MRRCWDDLKQRKGEEKNHEASERFHTEVSQKTHGNDSYFKDEKEPISITRHGKVSAILISPRTSTSTCFNSTSQLNKLSGSGWRLSNILSNQG